jgi:hypothetical protein
MIYAIFLIISQACEPAPPLAALFTPVHPRVGRYEVCTSEARIDDVADATLTIESVEPLDAFGTAGSYDRFAVTRLYGGRRARVAHGWREEAGRFESITLISPYPNASLDRLVEGTMIIQWTP